MVENRAKIRKKLRLANTPESRRSLLLELSIARALVADSRCRVEYEKYAPGKERSPDFAVTFRTRTLFHLEATLLQTAHGEAEDRVEKIIRLVGEKLGQSVPQTLNILAIATADGFMSEAEVSAAMKSLKQRVERRESGLPARAGFSAPADFFKRFQWLNGILLRSPAADGESPKTLLWANPQSRNPLPPDIGALLQTTIPLTPAAPAP